MRNVTRPLVLFRAGVLLTDACYIYTYKIILAEHKFRYVARDGYGTRVGRVDFKQF